MVAIGVGAYFVLRGETTMGNLIGMVQLLNYVVNPVAGFAGAISLVAQAKASSGRISELYDMPADERVSSPEQVNAVELVAENVSFAYTEDENALTLENVSASFKKGSVTGIAGKSGSGKSTLLKLLIGLYAPNSGKIELKHASGTLSGKDIMPQVAYVPPVDYLFSESILENIIMSENEPRMDDIKSAAGEANILDFIESSAEGFDTQLTEGGGGVSSGQAQRLAIARAIYKKSPVIVFDEPTANLDAESIEMFQSAVKGIAREKICIIVTHDLSTIGACDKVYNIENGGVCEQAAGENI
jgi:ABC-type bacteriocin/lantibiotic exporter with double-glycine peptidase domain